MASTTENLYVGDGSTVLYSFTFPYIEVQDIYVSVDGTDLTVLTEYTFANATTVQFITAPAAGAAIRIYRRTDSTELKAVFFPGSAIRARDLNDNFTQNLYVAQESDRDATAATEAAEAAAASAAAAAESAASAEGAVEAADEAVQKADQALAGVSTAQQAAVDAQAAADDAQSQVAIAQEAATQAGVDAAAAQQAAQDAADAVAEGPVVSVNGKQGLVVLELTDLPDVDTSSAGHVPADGQSLVWNESMGHWMPADATLVIGSLPTLP